MEAKVKKILINRGHNEALVNAVIKANLQDALRAYPDARASFIADVVISL